MSVVPPSDTFWMIMSTLTWAAARAVKTRAATPGRSGTPVDRHLGVFEGVGDARDDGLFHVLLFLLRIQVPGASVKLERTWMATP